MWTRGRSRGHWPCCHPTARPTFRQQTAGPDAGSRPRPHSRRANRLLTVTGPLQRPAVCTGPVCPEYLHLPSPAWDRPHRTGRGALSSLSGQRGCLCDWA